MQGTSMLGIWPIDEIIDWFSSAFTTYIVDPIVNFFSYVLGVILYGLQMGLFYIMDAVQLVFRRAAGLDIYYNNGVAVEGDLTIQFFQSSTVQAVFISILVAAIFLLFITTFIAVIKTEFDEKDNAKGPIFKNALKAILYFAIVPVVCFLGVWVSNMVLRMLDDATSRGAESFSTQVFTAAAFNANRARDDAEFAQNVYNNCKWIPGMESITYSQSGVADLIDTAFRSALQPTTDDHSAQVTINRGWDTTVTFSSFDKNNYNLVFYFYDPLDYNYIIGYISSVAVVMILLKLLIGVILRIFELTVLFVLSPLAVSLMPLDGGERYKAWRGAFVKRTFSAYGPIIGLNLVFMVLTLLQTVQLFPSGGINDLYNAIVQLIFIFTGLVAINSLVDLVTDLVGQGNALKEGEGAAKDVKSLGMKTTGQLASAGARPATWTYDRVANARNKHKTKKAAEGLAYDENGEVDIENGTEGLKGAGSGVRGWGRRRVGSVTSLGGLRQGAAGSMAEEYSTRRKQLQNAEKHLRAGGEYGIRDENGEFVTDADGNFVTKGVNYWKNTGHSVLKDLAKNIDLDKKVEDTNKAFGANPISGAVKKVLDNRADKKKYKDAKEEMEMKSRIEEELRGTPASQNTDTDWNRRKERLKKSNDNNGGLGDGTVGSALTSAESQGVGTGPVVDLSQTGEVPTISGDVPAGQQQPQSTETAGVNIDGGIIDEIRKPVQVEVSENDDRNLNVNTQKADFKSQNTENKGPNGEQKVKVDNKVKIDDAGIRQAVQDVATNVNSTKKSIESKLNEIKASLEKLGKSKTGRIFRDKNNDEGKE